MQQLVWLGFANNLHVSVAGTTDSPCEITEKPKPKEEEIQFVLSEIKNYLNPDVNGN